MKLDNININIDGKLRNDTQLAYNEDVCKYTMLKLASIHKFERFYNRKCQLFNL